MNGPSYDLGAALRYIERLRGDRQVPEVEAAPNVQPDLGPEAAGLLALWVRCMRPRAILEIGTALGTTACRLGREAAAYGGRILTIEVRPDLAGRARCAVEASGLAGTVEVACADARQMVPALTGRFELIIQDGGKEDYLRLLDPLLRLLTPGGLLVSDDVLFPVMDLPAQVRPWQAAIDAYNHERAARADLRTVWLPVGDGLALTARNDGDRAETGRRRVGRETGPVPHA
jgi:predicted O-methyltransferase YrrM